MRKILFCMGAFLCLFLAGCSNDDEVSISSDDEVSSSSNDEEKEDSSIKVDFRLQDANGSECYDFQEGDNIVFRLEIKNNTNEMAILPSIFEIIGYDVFRVYSVNDEDMGTPWDQLFGDCCAAYMIDSHSSAIIVCPWFDISALAYNGHEHFYSGCFHKKEEKKPLPRGNYYSKFDIKLKDETITCYKTFIIQ